MLVCARLRYIAGHKWRTERYLNMRPLYRLPFNNSAPAGHLEARGAPKMIRRRGILMRRKSHGRTEFLVSRNQGKHPDRGCAKASPDDRISGRGELDRASPKKMCEKFWTISKIESGLRIPFYFADPNSPWQKGSDENTNGLLRENFPKKSNLSIVTQRDLYWERVYRINNRPGKVLR